MKKKINKKAVAFITAGAVIVAGVGLGVASLTGVFSGENEPGKPGATPTPTNSVIQPSPGAQVDSTTVLTQEQIDALPETTQFIEGVSGDLGAVVSYSYPEGASNDYTFLEGVTPTVSWAAQEYIQGALFNPYFIADWWGQEDSNDTTGPTTHFYPYLSSELQAEFTEKIDAYKAGDEEAEQWLASRMFLPSEEYQIREECYANWDASMCWANNETAGEIVSAEAFFLSQTEVQMTVEVKTGVQYMHPGYEDGSIGAQERTYKLDLRLEFSEGPDLENLEDTTKPYVKITSVEGETTAGPITDYLVFGNLPPAP